MSIQLDSVSFSPPGDFSLHCDNLKIEQGKFTVVIGQNGSGKTSLVEAILGIKGGATCAGTIGGTDLSRMHTDKRFMRNVGFQMQGMAFPTGVRVKEVIRLHHLLYGADNTRLSDILKLERIMSKKYGFCSLGEKSRTELYFACAHTPQYLFFDEPTRGLDRAATDDFIEWLNQYRRDHPEFLALSTSHAERELDIADHLIWMKHGCVNYSGSKDAFMDQHLGAFRLDVVHSQDTPSADLPPFAPTFTQPQPMPQNTYFGGEQLKDNAAKLLKNNKVDSASVRPTDTRDILEYVTRDS